MYLPRYEDSFGSRERFTWLVGGGGHNGVFCIVIIDRAGSLARVILLFTVKNLSILSRCVAEDFRKQPRNVFEQQTVYRKGRLSNDIYNQRHN